MSYGASAVAWHHSKATGTDLLVLMAIANYIGDDGAWPKVETIAKDARTNERQVARALNNLVALGEIRRDSKAGRGAGAYKSNRYWILLTCPPECSGDWNHTTRQTVTSRPDTPSPLDLTPTADKPVIEPVKEPYIPTKKKSQIKENWKPSESLSKTIDSKQKWATVNATEELEKFINYHMAKGSMMVDWDRAFMTWLTNAEKWAKDKAAPSADRSRIKGWFE